jgi:hypothetical protein
VLPEREMRVCHRDTAKKKKETGAGVLYPPRSRAHLFPVSENFLPWRCTAFIIHVLHIVHYPVYTDTPHALGLPVVRRKVFDRRPRHRRRALASVVVV